MVQGLVRKGDKLGSLGQDMIRRRCNSKADRDKFGCVRFGMWQGKPKHGFTDALCQDYRLPGDLYREG